MEKINNQAFCVLPFMHVAGDPAGKVKLCCLSKNYNVDEQGNSYNLGKDKVVEFFNSDYMKKVRKQMLSGELVSDCSSCYQEEQSGGISQRTTYTNEWLTSEPQLVEKILQSENNDYYVEPEIKYFDFRFGNMCNLKCRSCGPVNSIQLLKETREIEKNNPEIRKYFLFDDNQIDSINDWYQTEVFRENFNAQKNNVSQIYFTGGEPTIIEQNYEILQQLVDSGRSEKVTLIFSTNMTNIQGKFLELIQKFQYVRILASCEGYGDIHEYLRYPAKWSQFEKNIRKLAECDPNKINIMCTPVVQSVNLSRIVEFFEWIDSINDEYKFERIHMLPIVLTFPDHLDFEILPDEMKINSANKIKEYISNKRINPHFLGRINMILDKCSKSSYNPLLLKKFDRFTEILDKQREQSLSSVNPELYKLIKSL